MTRDVLYKLKHGNYAALFHRDAAVRSISAEGNPCISHSPLMVSVVQNK